LNYPRKAGHPLPPFFIPDKIVEALHTVTLILEIFRCNHLHKIASIDAHHAIAYNKIMIINR
jgi:hypothetical protein